MRIGVNCFPKSVWSSISVVVVLLLATCLTQQATAAGRICPRARQPKQTRQIQTQCGKSSYLNSNYFNHTSRSPGKQNRISGGRDARKNEFPSFVSLVILNSYGQQMLCSGVLIDRDFVLTAAHCLDTGRIIEVHVGIGISNPKYWSTDGTKLIKGLRYCKSNRWSGKPRILYDYAVIKMREPVELSESVQTACLPNYPIREGGQAYTVGVGTMDDWKQYPHVAQVLPVGRVRCEGWNQHNTHICFKANQYEYQGDSCVGDSGGPVYVNEGGKWAVIGLTSYGLTDRCTKGFSYISVNADVYNQRDHILDLVNACQSGGGILLDGDEEDDYDDDDDDDYGE